MQMCARLLPGKSIVQPETDGEPAVVEVCLDSNRPCGRHALIEADRGNPIRRELETFVHAAFVRAHGAHVRSFMPTLLGLRSHRGLCGVVGFRLAHSEPLYLEHYLERPIQALIAEHSGKPAQRDEIVEVGNLAGASCRAACHLVAVLPQYLLARQQRWIVFTATSAVRTVLRRLNAPVFELSPAHAHSVSGQPDHWGRYYESDPRVMVGYLPDSKFMRGIARAMS